MQIKPYGKSELAMLYAGEQIMTPQGALNRLNEWMRRNPALWQALLDSGYQVKQKIFTSYQVRLIVEYLGEP